MQAFDLTGQQFFGLTVVGRAPNSASGAAQWECRCFCGATKIVRADNLRRGTVRSCGAHTSAEIPGTAANQKTSVGIAYVTLVYDEGGPKAFSNPGFCEVWDTRDLPDEVALSDPEQGKLICRTHAVGREDHATLGLIEARRAGLLEYGPLPPHGMTRVMRQRWVKELHAAYGPRRSLAGRPASAVREAREDEWPPETYLPDRWAGA